MSLLVDACIKNFLQTSHNTAYPVQEFFTFIIQGKKIPSPKFLFRYRCTKTSDDADTLYEMPFISVLMLMKYTSGNTPIIKEEYFCKKFGLPNFYIKDESCNPFGTYKDRRSEVIVRKALDECVDKLVLITSGNAGFSLAKFALGSRLKVVCIVDKHISQSFYKKLCIVSYKVIRIDLSKKILKPEEIISLAREKDEDVIWDVTNGWHESYKSIINEIKNQQAKFLITPVGSGEAFVGLFNGIQKNKLNVRLIGVMPQSCPSFADKLHTLWTPYSSKLKSIVKTKHQIIKVSEKEIKQAYSLAKKYIQCEPSSAIVYSALSHVKIGKKDKVIIINSGKGLL